jgi:hypothetical protein
VSKKLKLYALIFVNLLAWGYVGNKIYGVLQGDDEAAIDNSTYAVKPVIDAEKKENQQLALNYPDPFLKNVKIGKQQHQNDSYNNTPSTKNNSSVNNTTPNSIQRPIAIKTNTVTVVPPVNITYLGLVNNNDKGTQTALIMVNGSSVYAKINDVVEGYKVALITIDEIVLQKGKEKLSVRR